MRQTRPLPDTHPEFTVLYWQGFTEYRVEHWRLARDGSGRIVRGTCVWSWADVGVLLVAGWVVLAWFEVQVPVPVPIPVFVPRTPLVVGIGIALTWLVWARCTQVLHESLLVFPTLGIQLETHLGHPLLSNPIFTTTTHHFIPLSALEDVILHEGFRRWDVRYYLAALYRRTGTPSHSHSSSSLSSRTPTPLSVSSSASTTATPEEFVSGVVQVRVAFENILPYFPVLKVVYLGVQETLFPPPTRVVETDG